MTGARIAAIHKSALAPDPAAPDPAGRAATSAIAISGELSTIRARLLALAQNGHLRPAAGETASRLAGRIDAPARAVLFGLPGSGKSSLVNRLLGREVMPPGNGLSAVLIGAGAVPRAHAILADGRRRDWAGSGAGESATVPLAAIARAHPAMVEVTLPDPVLREISLLEIGAGASRADQLAAFAWAAPRCDIALWVSRRFDAFEAALWDAAPLALREAGYLVLTGDTPLAGTPASFRGVFTDAGRDAGGDLAQMLRAAARQGRESLLDHALLFLRRYRALEPPLAASAAAPIIIPAAPLAPPEAAGQPPSDAPAQGGQVVSLMRDCAENLLAQLHGPEDEQAGRIFARCRRTLDEACRLLARAQAGDLEDAALDAADALMLLEGEGARLTGAADAVALMLQVRRDVEARLAA